MLLTCRGSSFRYTDTLILTLTINPAVDRNVTVDRLAFEDRGYILSTDETPGGRGINASRVIHSFGGKTIALAVTGGPVENDLKASPDAAAFQWSLCGLRITSART